jgi:flagellar protein FlbD
MIAVTRLDGAGIFVNVDLIESVEPTPDTLISLVNGTKLFVLETPAEVIDRAIAYKRAVNAAPARTDPLAGTDPSS